MVLPTTRLLAYGDYLANKVPFPIKEGTQSASVAIFLQVQTRAKDRTWLWVEYSFCRSRRDRRWTWYLYAVSGKRPE